MPQSIAVAIVHGIGRQKPDFADGIIQQLQNRFLDKVGPTTPGAQPGLVIRPVYWAPVLQGEEDELVRRLRAGGGMGWFELREFMVDFAADAIAYQPQSGRRDAYDQIHAVFAEALKALAAVAGPRAPLCVIAHSLGTVIASNFLYDLQTHPQKPIISSKVAEKMGDTPLDRGETLTLLYTLGSPIALWSLRYPGFGQPIHVPSPMLAQHYPGLQGEWVNFYDKADVIGYPLRELNAAYNQAVTTDRAVRVGPPWISWTPLSHTEYFEAGKVCEPIAEALARTWRAINPSP